MNRRGLILSGLAAAGVSACASPRQPSDPLGADAEGPGVQPPRYDVAPGASANPGGRPPAYTQQELVHAGSDFLGVAAESVGGAIDRIVTDQGAEPTAYIAGEEGSGAFAVGLRYGRGLIYMKNGARPQEVFWQGPSIGWDFGGNAARVFTLVYNLERPDEIYRRFPGVEGSAYLIGGLGVNYQQAEGITLAPIRAGVGLRLGANIGYLAYSRERNWFPL